MQKLGYSSKPTSGYILAIFTTQKRFWLNNRQIKVYTLSDRNPLYKDFVKSNLKEALNKLNPFAVRPAHHERIQQITVRPELVEGLNQRFLNMFPHQVRRVWDRTAYSGTGSAPIGLGSGQEMIGKIASTPESIGYLNSKPSNENIQYHAYGTAWLPQADNPVPSQNIQD